MWRRRVEGGTLTFHLAGINNQNFLMRDEETGSWWQQITGTAVSGPLKGRHLDPVRSDELTFALWRRESPQGRVLAPVDRDRARYEKADWETEVGKLPTVVPVGAATLPAREIVLGLNVGGRARAYPQSAVLAQSPILDAVGGTPVLVVAGPDGSSIRAFRATANGRALDFFAAPKGEPWALLDGATQSRWSFQGCALSGALQGSCLEPLPILKDYWFDWQLYHPGTTIYRH